MLTLRRTNNRFPSVFDSFLNDNWMERANASSDSAAMNIIENENEYKVELAAPGLTKENFDIRLDEDTLVISMENKSENEEKDGERYLRREFSHTKYERRIAVPETVNKEKIDAKVENGVLSIELPKMQEEELKKLERNIEVR